MKKITLIVSIAALFSLSGCTFLAECCTDGVFHATLNGNQITQTITFSYQQGDSKTIQISCPLPWIVSQKPTWLHIDPEKGDGSKNIVMTVCSKNDTNDTLSGEVLFLAANGDKLVIKVEQKPDRFLAFKANSRPRWEEADGTVNYNDESPYTFLSDETGALNLLSTKFKTGRITNAEGSNYEILEFTGPATLGVKSGAQIRTHLTTKGLYILEIVKTAYDPVMDKEVLWIVFKETAAATERRVVQ